jgi:hypothetical protein
MRDKPLLDAAEIADIVAFLKTLDDGYSLSSGSKSRCAGLSNCR